MRSTSAPTLVVVAYPSDETIAFASVCRGSDIVAVGSGCENASSAVLRREFQQAARKLGARRALYLDLSWDDPFPEEVLEKKLRALKPYRRVYTHSPFDEDTCRVNVVLAVSKVFGSIWVQATGSPPMETNTLSLDDFYRKMEIVNRFYSERLHAINNGSSLSPTALLGVEAFTQITRDEVIRAVAVSSDRILAHPDVWGFWYSPYELQRCLATCELLLEHLQPRTIKNILEVGACEGEMTQRLCQAFPRACLTAIESEPFFAKRLRERFRGDENVTVLESSVTDVPLQADLIVFAEVLYYLGEQELQATLDRLQAKYVLIGCDGEFDTTVGEILTTMRWRDIGSRRIQPRFEPVDGKQSRLIACRQGTNVRLWKRSRSR